MRRIMTITPLMILFFLLTTQLKAQTDKSKCDCGPSPVSPEEVNTYTTNYSEIFIGTKNRKHTKEIFLSRDYVQFINEYFNKYPSDKGVWIFFSSLKNIEDPNQQIHRHQILIQMVAADKDRKLKFEDGFANFMQSSSLLKNPATNKILVNWGKEFNSNSTLGPEYIVSMSQNKSEEWRKKYTKRFRFLNQRHSKALFLCKETFYALWLAIKDSPDYDGLIFSFASYTQKEDCTGQVRKKQLTLIATPSKNKKPDYQAFFSFLSQKNLTTSYNHGELCPKKCPY